MDWSKIAAVTVAALADRDINISLDVATNALENNFLPLLIVGVTAAGVAMAAYEVTQVYKEQGIEAAAKQLGIEIVVGAAGAVTGAAAGRLAGKVAYRYGGKVYHSLSEAVDVVFKANPGLKLALGRFANQIKDTAARVGNTKAGQLYHRANQSAENLVNRASDKVGQLMGRPQKQGTNILTGEKENKGKEVVGKKRRVSEETVETAPNTSASKPSSTPTVNEPLAVDVEPTYHPRIRARALQDPVAHNFPYSFDQIILKTKPIIQQDGSLIYKKAGTLNGKNGVFEIAINPQTNTIFHRTFKGQK